MSRVRRYLSVPQVSCRQEHVPAWLAPLVRGHPPLAWRRLLERPWDNGEADFQDSLRFWHLPQQGDDESLQRRERIQAARVHVRVFGLDRLQMSPDRPTRDLP